MFKVTLTGFDTKEQAQQWLNWFSGQGEQDECIPIWIPGVSAVYTTGPTTEVSDGFEKDVKVHYQK